MRVYKYALLSFTNFIYIYMFVVENEISNERQSSTLDLPGHKFLQWTPKWIKCQGIKHIKSVIYQQKDATISTTSVKIETEQEKAKVLFLLKHHLHDSFKEDLLGEVPKELWDSLTEWYGNEKVCSSQRHILTPSIWSSRISK